MPEVRRTPEQILRQIQEGEDQESKGKFKLFLGASAGVGKTYAMLSEAKQLLDRGIDVVVGEAVTHGRKETERLVYDLPAIPKRKVEYRGVLLDELDLDAILLRRPQIVLIDELAHTNVPGSRHSKRWHDVQELLDAGISVYSALNIQHLESLNDVVAQISGIRVKETVPDAALERADELELVDITPDELRQRVREGKVYIPEQIDKALDGFFKTGNLIALRELALRRVADQIDEQMQTYRERTGVSDLWATRDRILVCVAPNRLAEKVLRTGSRISQTSKRSVTALFVESKRQRRRTPSEIDLAAKALQNAESLGIEVVRRSGYDIVGEILRFAQTRNISLIVVGKPIKPRWKEILLGSVVDELIRRSGEINVYVISADEEERKEIPKVADLPKFNHFDLITAALYSGGATAVAGVTDLLLPHENIVMIYILGIALCASKFRFGTSLLCSLFSVLAYDFFFIPPRHQFSVSDVAYIPTFAIMLILGMIISALTTQLKEQVRESGERERRSSALFDATREMAKTRGRDKISIAATRRLSEDVDVDLAVLLPNETGRLSVVARSRSHFENDHREMPVANWVFDNGRPAGAGTDTLPSAAGIYLPLQTPEATVGVLGIRASIQGGAITASERSLIGAFGSSLAMAIERANLASESAKSRIEVESEKLRNALLSSVSHDIRSPLTAIAGAASAMVSGAGDTKSLAETIYNESQRLNRHVRDLLDMTRLESGSIQPKLEWNSVEEIVGTALSRTDWQLQGRAIGVSLSDHLPLLKLDSSLLEQAVINILENAGKHTPKGSPIEIDGQTKAKSVVISIIDHGPGISGEAKKSIFEKFHQHRKDETGFGLGLAIARAAVLLNGGKINVSDTLGGGTTFEIELPASEVPPEVPNG